MGKGVAMAILVKDPNAVVPESDELVVGELYVVYSSDNSHKWTKDTGWIDIPAHTKKSVGMYKGTKYMTEGDHEWDAMEFYKGDETVTFSPRYHYFKRLTDENVQEEE